MLYALLLQHIILRQLFSTTPPILPHYHSLSLSLTPKPCLTFCILLLFAAVDPKVKCRPAEKPDYTERFEYTLGWVKIAADYSRVSF